MNRFLPLVLVALFLAGAPLTAQQASPTMILATTTSTQQTGLLDVLLPAFTKATGIMVKPIAVGTGKAIELARNGDADAVMVHARKLEDQFVAEGFGIEAWDLMYNDFVLVGPASDPSGIKGSTAANAVFRKLAAGQTRFVSRGDNSGTHTREKELWSEAGATMPAGLYMEAGQGMTETLTMANELLAYTLCDRATWLTMRKKSALIPVYENPTELKNAYGIMAVSSGKAPKANTELGKKLVEWVVSPAGQEIIQSFAIDGEPLFHLSVKKR